MGVACLVYPGLCQEPFDILNKSNFKFVRCHRGATVSFFPTEVVTNYIAGTSNQASPGFRILLETVIGQSYQLKTTSELTLGDKAFIYIENPDGTRLVPRTNCFLNGAGSTSYVIDFTATNKLTYVGILFLKFNVSYSLTTTEFLVNCLDPVDCNQVIDCLCQIDQCLDEYTYEICVDFLQVHLDLLNSPASFPAGTMLSIQGYRIDEGIVDVGATGLPQLIGNVPVTFNQVRSAFDALTWQTIDLGLLGEFRSLLKNQVLIISHVLIDSDLNVGPPFSINLPTNCTKLDACATNNAENRLLIKKPDNSLCWSNICPTLIDTCTTKCGLEDHVGILPDETLSSNASLSVGPRGSGFLCAQKPLPGSVSGGDCRGQYAVDWQMFRDTSDDVAGANFSAIGGGASNHIQDGEIAFHVYGTTGAEGSVIAGGFSNEINIEVFDDGDFPFIPPAILGFIGMTGTDLSFSTISGGLRNQIKVEAEDQSSFFSGRSVIAGGSDNLIKMRSLPSGGYSYNSRNASSAIGGGSGNLIETQGNFTRADFSVIAGGGGTGLTGTGNVIRAVGEYLNYTHYSVISGGERNQIEALGHSSDASHSVIGGGGRNQIQSLIGGSTFVNFSTVAFTTIDGGLDNRIGADDLNSLAEFSVIGGGNANKIVAKNPFADASNAVIAGGAGNKIYAYSTVRHSIIGGGQSNLIKSYGIYNSNHSLIVGGLENSVIESMYSTIGGGKQNNITKSDRSCIAGGSKNKIQSALRSQYSVISGGYDNKISTNHSVIGGGQGNSVVGLNQIDSHNSIVGGLSNTIDGAIASTILGGKDNDIKNGKYSVVGGGRKNIISGSLANDSVIAGGYENQSSMKYSVISGGQGNSVVGLNPGDSHNSIVGGLSNTIDIARASTIIGGSGNAISNGKYSVVGGKGSTSQHDNCFVFGDSAGSTGPNQVVFNAIPMTPIVGGQNVVVKPNGTLGVGPDPVTRGCSVFYLDYDMTGDGSAPAIDWALPTNWGDLNNPPPNGFTDAVIIDNPSYSPINGDLVIMILYTTTGTESESYFARSCIFKYENNSWVVKRVLRNALDA